MQILASGMLFKTVSWPTKIGSCLCSFATWVFLMTCFAYFADKVYGADDLEDPKYGPGFGATVTACWLAFVGMFVPFWVADMGSA